MTDLVALDIGGTHARFAWQSGPGAAVEAPLTLRCADHASLADAAKHVLERLARSGHAAPCGARAVGGGLGLEAAGRGCLRCCCRRCARCCRPDADRQNVEHRCAVRPDAGPDVEHHDRRRRRYPDDH